MAALDVNVDDDEEALARIATEAAGRVVAAGLERVDDDLFILELGIVERTVDTTTRRPLPAGDLTAEAMRTCRQICEAVADGRYSSYAAAGRAAGLGQRVTIKYCALRKLSESVQRDVLDGKASGRALDDLLRIARIADADEQERAFAELIAIRPGRAPRQIGAEQSPSVDHSHTPEGVRVRAVTYFNPQRFVEQRLRARKQQAQIQAFADELNRRLASPRSKQKRDAIAAAIDQRLRRDDLLDAYAVHIDTHQIADRCHHQVRLELETANWARRSRHDGFVVLVAHPDLPHSAAELCVLYRAKDAVEKDFQVIKSLIKLRPVRHRTDRKVRAHVTLCMLALLLERSLKRQLKGKYTAGAALEHLGSCHLNRYARAGPPSTTSPEPR